MWRSLTCVKERVTLTLLDSATSVGGGRGFWPQCHHSSEVSQIKEMLHGVLSRDGFEDGGATQKLLINVMWE